VRDWAIKVEQGKTGPQLPNPKPNWGEIFKQLQDNTDIRTRLDEWNPRKMRPGEDFQESGKPENYGEGTPERALVEFLVFWQRRNYGRMAYYPPFSSYHPKHEHGKRAQQFREHYDGRELTGFSLLDVRDAASALTVIQVRLTLLQAEKVSEQTVNFRLVYEMESGATVPRGKLDGSWHILTYFV